MRLVESLRRLVNNDERLAVEDPPALGVELVQQLAPDIVARAVPARLDILEQLRLLEEVGVVGRILGPELSRPEDLAAGRLEGLADGGRVERADALAGVVELRDGLFADAGRVRGL